ncbi:MAG: zinc ABC transporter substrate-binding protein [Mariprofundales bacterium]
MKKILLGLAMGLLASSVSAQPAGSLVVATLPPLAGMVQLLLPNAQPTCLLANNGDPHHLNISPRKVEQLRVMQLLVRSSGDDGGWSGLQAIHSTVVDLWPQAHHPWLLPSDVGVSIKDLAETMASNKLISFDYSRKMIKRVTRQMQQLDADWAQLLQPLQRRGVIMQHPAWERLFAHYKVPVRAVLEHSHHGDGATPRQLEAALKLLRTTNPPLLIVERSHANRMIDWLRQQVPAAQVVTLDALGVCGQPLDGLLQDNMAQLRQVLSP